MVLEEIEVRWLDIVGRISLVKVGIVRLLGVEIRFWTAIFSDLFFSLDSCGSFRGWVGGRGFVMSF